MQKVCLSGTKVSKKNTEVFFCYAEYFIPDELTTSESWLFGVQTSCSDLLSLVKQWMRLYYTSEYLTHWSMRNVDEILNY